MLDEATASCDAKTDKTIQEVVGRVFADCTVLTIAHRIHTIANSDRILVMDKGVIAEFDTPANLLKQKDGIYSRLLSESANVGAK